MHEIPDIHIQYLCNLQAHQNQIHNYDGRDDKHGKGNGPGCSPQRCKPNLQSVISRPQRLIVVHDRLYCCNQQVDRQNQSLETDSHQ